MYRKLYTDKDTGYIVDERGRVVISWFAKRGVKPTAFTEYRMREILREAALLGAFPEYVNDKEGDA